MTGLEPARIAPQEPKSCASANFATSAFIILVVEVTGFEPAASTSRT